MDRLRCATLLDQLYTDILHLHEDHNKSKTLLAKVKKYYNIATNICPGCIERAPKMKPLVGLGNITRMVFRVQGQCNIIDLQSMVDGFFYFLFFSMPLTSCFLLN